MEKRSKSGISKADRKEAAKHQQAREQGHALRYTLKTGAKRLVKPTRDEKKKAQRSAPPHPNIMDEPGDQMTG